MRVVAFDVHGFDDVAFAFNHSERQGDVACLIVDLRGDLDVAEAIGLIDALQVLDAGVEQILAVASVRKDVGFFHRHVLEQVVFF